jgi:ribosomal protein S18 acetylase RimI-like enzyme
MVGTPWQRQGIGRKLVSQAVVELQRHRVTSMLVAVQVDNPNWAFYERLGGRLVGRRPLDWEGYETEVVLYGWDDISVLVEKEA